jgi:hypothetical protein
VAGGIARHDKPRPRRAGTELSPTMIAHRQWDAAKQIFVPRAITLLHKFAEKRHWLHFSASPKYERQRSQNCLRNAASNNCMARRPT